ncbi:histidine kinase [Actinomadura sp. ATCC 31491]|uniref:Histidine kinase n=1 Tax=Actinomadura luzonensis TaxID=2805427 RepID=A0ABT0G258_9ACTN|nr:histidine kinase [Actinomadura luzonensis]MCK2218696.1 histidine kinase [Actinomadura luzonensis]
MSPSIPPPWVLRHPHWPLIALHVPLTLQVPVYTILGMDGPPGDPLVAILLAALAGAIQLRHSLAAARGERPAGWPLTLTAIILIADVPIWWLGSNWEGFGIFALASSVVLLRGRLMPAVAVVQLLINAAREMLVTVQADDWTVPQLLLMGLYAVIATSLYAAALVGGARLALLVTELDATRAELAATAVGEERIRVSRDLHDLLGQSLSAIALKGDLALRLLINDTEAARAEIESLTGVARDALRDVRAITRDEHAVSLRTEIDGAAALLHAAGVETRLDVADLPPLTGPAQDALAWAIREGTTNLLRHSDARTCAIILSRDDGKVHLEIVNDGVRALTDDPTPARPAPGRPTPAHLSSAQLTAAASAGSTSNGSSSAGTVDPSPGGGNRHGTASDGAGRAVVGHGSGLSGVAERVRAVSGSSAATVRDGRFRLSVEVPEEAV